MIKYLTKDNFIGELKDKLVLVDFFAQWCGPCKMLGPVLEELDAENIVDIIKIDVDIEKELAQKYRVMTIPTLILFKNGKVVKQAVGFQSLSKLKEFIKE